MNRGKRRICVLVLAGGVIVLGAIVLLFPIVSASRDEALCFGTPPSELTSRPSGLVGHVPVTRAG